MKRKLAAILTLSCALPTVLAVYGSPSKEASSGWFRESRYGIFIHFLGGGKNWEETVCSFKVETFADQVERTRAGYVIFTLGQNSGFYCSPNRAYERLAGYSPGARCSMRDLPMELGRELRSRGIRLMLYLPSRSPQEDDQAMKALGDVDEREPAPQEFTRKWSEVIREWSLRYGELVSGWWFDGAYNTAGWDDLSQPFNWKTWASAARAGNPSSILAFNRGAEIKHAFIKQTDEQDYTAGEQNRFRVTPESDPAPFQLQWQILAHLGSRWAYADGPQETDEYMLDYIRKVNDQGGVVTMEVHCSPEGSIYPPHLNQLLVIGERLKPE